MKYYSPTTFINNSLWFGQPYIVNRETTCTPIVNPVFQGVTVTGTAPVNSPTDEGSGNITFRGTYSPIDYASDNNSIY